MSNYNQIQNAVKAVVGNFPSTAVPVLTDIHVVVREEKIIFEDDDHKELATIDTRDWNRVEMDKVVLQINQAVRDNKNAVEEMSVFQPFSFVLDAEDGETLRDIYIVDGVNEVILEPLLEGWDRELDKFIDDLLK